MSKKYKIINLDNMNRLELLHITGGTLTNYSFIQEDGSVFCYSQKYNAKINNYLANKHISEFHLYYIFNNKIIKHSFIKTKDGDQVIIYERGYENPTFTKIHISLLTTSDCSSHSEQYKEIELTEIIFHDLTKLISSYNDILEKNKNILIRHNEIIQVILPKFNSILEYFNEINRILPSDDQFVHFNTITDKYDELISELLNY
jgi:hypothetical protein